MQKKILEFTNILRKSGIRVSTAEAIDSFTALDELSIDDREIFKDALRATMVKRGEEVSTYDQLFDLFWSGFYDSLRESFGQATAGLGEMGTDFEALLQQIMQMLQGMEGELGGDLSELARALLALNATELDAELGNQTLNVILKYEGDVRKAQAELDKLLQKKAGEARAAKPVAAPEPAPAATKKGALH